MRCFPSTCFVIAGLLMFGCLLPSYTRAQNPVETVSINLQFSATGIVGEHHTLWLRTGPGAEAIEVRLNKRTFSMPVKYRGPVKAYFFESQEIAQSELPAVRPIASCTLASSDSLLVFIPLQTQDDVSSRYGVFSTLASSFDYGSLNFANFSKADILVQAGEGTKPIKIDPNGNHTFKLGKAGESLSIRVAADAPGAEPRLIRQTRFSTHPGWRELVCFFDQPNGGRVRLHHIVDVKTTNDIEDSL